MKWLFGFGSPVTMGLTRAIIGTLAFINFAMIAIDFEAWFTEKGFYPAWMADRWASGVPRLNLLAGVTDSRVTAAFYVICMASCLLVAVGFFSRVSSVVMFATIVTLHYRNPDILHSGDTLLRNMAFLVMVSPSGAAFSLDRWIALRKGVAPSQPPPVSLWPQRLVQIQVVIVYLTTVWHKMIGTTWRNGTATWYPPHLYEFKRFPVPEFMLSTPMVALTTYGTLVVELALATLVFAKPFRKWVLLSGLLLHAGIEYQFNIPMFAFVMTSTYVSFYEGGEVVAWFERARTRIARGK